MRRYFGIYKGKQHRVVEIDGLKITLLGSNFKITQLDSPTFAEKLVEECDEDEG